MNPRSRLPVERRLGDRMRARLPHGVAECVMFVLKQGWACLFGGVMLALLIGTKAIWQPDWALARYDFLLIAALGIQAAFLALRLETLDEARVMLEAGGKWIETDGFKITFLTEQIKKENRRPESVHGKSYVYAGPILRLRERVEKLLNKKFEIAMCLYYPDGNHFAPFHFDSHFDFHFHLKNPPWHHS